MIDSSIILNIIKHEKNCDIFEDKLNNVLNEGAGFITHISLSEVYKEVLEFIKKEIEIGVYCFLIKRAVLFFQDDVSTPRRVEGATLFFFLFFIK
jgi:hypothetical protein